MIVQDAYEVYLAYNLYLKPKTNDKKKKIQMTRTARAFRAILGLWLHMCLLTYLSGKEGLHFRWRGDMKWHWNKRQIFPSGGWEEEGPTDKGKPSPTQADLETFVRKSLSLKDSADFLSPAHTDNDKRQQNCSTPLGIISFTSNTKLSYAEHFLHVKQTSDSWCKLPGKKASL